MTETDAGMKGGKGGDERGVRITLTDHVVGAVALKEVTQRL